MKRNPTSPELCSLVEALGRKKGGFYRTLAKHLARRNAVDLRIIDKAASNDEAVVVPGKVLSDGELSKPVTVYAWKFSKAAHDKITKTGGRALPLAELLAAEHTGRIVI